MTRDSTHDADDAAHEPDPTGMRDLLAGLGDPGPMPDELVERIRARLEAEDQGRGEPTTGSTGSTAAPATVTHAPFGSDRESRASGRTPRTGRWILGAAAAAAVVLGGGTVLKTFVTDASQDISAPSDMNEDAGGGNEAAGSAPSSSTDAGDMASSKAGIVLSVSGRNYTRDALAEQAADTLTSPAEVPEHSNEAPSIGPMGTQRGAADCLSEHTDPPVDPLLVDVATFDGRPGFLLVARDGEEVRAWAVTQDCREIWDPVTLDQH